MSVLAVLATAAASGVPLVLWLYVVLSALYLPAVAFAWLQQSREPLAMHGTHATTR
jgi:hypothetical protein